jgi:hypothetical protein
MRRRHPLVDLAVLTARLASIDPATWLTQAERDEVFDRAGAGTLAELGPRVAQLARYLVAAYGEPSPLVLAEHVEHTMVHARRRAAADELAELTGRPAIEVWAEAGRATAVSGAPVHEPDEWVT